MAGSRALRGGNLLLLRRQNRSVVLRAIGEPGPTSRNALARGTGLGAASITRIVDELLSLGLVREHPALVNGPGRPPIPLEVVPEAGLVASIHIGSMLAQVALVDLRGEIRSLRKLPHVRDEGPEALLTRLKGEAGAMLRALEPPSGLVGVGVGCVGLVNPDAGLLLAFEQLGWE